MIHIFEEAGRLQAQNIPFAIVTITKAQGSTPRSQARMIVLADGSTIGTVGGGSSEFMAIQRAVELIPQRKHEFLDISLTVAEGHNCGGVVQLYIEVIDTAQRIILIGGGHVNLEIAKIASSCGYYVELVETRAEYAQKDRFPTVAKFHVGESIEKALSSLTIDELCAIVIATHNLDKEVLERVIDSPAFYIGMLGSRTKVNGYRRYLQETYHIKDTLFDRFYSPIGLDIGSETPEQIAVSVIAEIMKVAHKKSGLSLSKRAENLVIIRGAGDLATGVATRLHKGGYRVLLLEIEKPTTIRRSVAFSEACYEGEVTIDTVVCKKATSIAEAKSILDMGNIALLCDPQALSISALNPSVVVDAIIAKKNLGTHKKMAPLVICLGPGFTAPIDCDVVIETQRGHYLGAIITNGEAQHNTGIPAVVNGYGEERVIHSPVSGFTKGHATIGQKVTKGQVIAHVGDTEVFATIDGVLRGLIHDDLHIPQGMKMADIDPRGETSYCYSISDKAYALGGAVLEVVDAFHAGKIGRR